LRGEAYHAGELYVIGLDAAGIRKISGDLDRDVTSFAWAPSGDGLYFSADDRGSRNVYFTSLTGKLRQVTEGAQMLSLGSVSKDGVGVGVRSTPHEPEDIVRFPLESPREGLRLTKVNDDVLEGIRLGTVEELWYTSSDGTRVQGWIVKPPAFDPRKRYPLILDIHGGPHSMYNVGFSYEFQHLAANGYVVLYTNPRGSSGYGSAFGNVIREAFPGVDYVDLMVGVDMLIARGYVDPRNLFVMGASGGGILTSWIVGHTDRFAAAAATCTAVNFISLAGTTDATILGLGFANGYPCENPEAWLKLSPLKYVGNVKTPTLLVTSERDLRTPSSQTEEFYHALKILEVPTVLLRFHGDSHCAREAPSNFVRLQLYLLSWFGRYGTRARSLDGSH